MMEKTTASKKVSRINNSLNEPILTEDQLNTQLNTGKNSSMGHNPQFY